MKCILKVGKNEYDYNSIKLIIYSSYINNTDKDDVFWGPIHKQHPENFIENFQSDYSELFIKSIDNDQSVSLMTGCNLINICRFKNMIDDAFCYDNLNVPYIQCVKNENDIITTKIVDVVKAHNVFVENMKKEINSQDNDIIPLLSLEALA